MKNFTFVLLLLSLLISCTKEAPEAPTTCQPGYMGPNCDIEIMPTRMGINRVVVTKFPATEPSGAGWDVFDGPDVKILIRHGGVVVYESSAFYEDATPAGRYTFLPNIVVNNPGQVQTSFEVLDYDDTLAPDFMGAVSGYMYQDGRGFPETLAVQCAACTVAFEVGVVYSFE